MAFKDGSRQIVKVPLTGLAFIPLAIFLLCMKPALDDLRRITGWTAHSFRPTQLANHFITLGIVYQILNMDQHILPTSKNFGLFYINLLETNYESVFKLHLSLAKFGMKAAQALLCLTTGQFTNSPFAVRRAGFSSRKAA